jgi:hypothetical protein
METTFQTFNKKDSKISVSMISSPTSGFSNVVRINKFKINYGHNTVVVSIAMVVVITNTYFLQIQPALLHQVGHS